MLTYDRVTAAKLGLTVQALDSALYSAFGQSQVSLIYTQLNQYYVVLEVAPQYWQTPDGFKDIYLAVIRTTATSRFSPWRQTSPTPFLLRSITRACFPRSRSHSTWLRSLS